MSDSPHLSSFAISAADLLSTIAPSVSRREFIGLAIGAAVASSTPLDSVAQNKGDVGRRTLGRTGEKVAMIGIGGYHMGMQQDEQESIRIVRTAVDGGINFLDNCWDYNNGTSEVRMGKALRDGYRQKVFLMSKIDGRTKASAAFQIDQSLQRLQTDHVDLMQFHEVIRPDDPDRIFAVGGAIEAMVAAQKAGKVRYIGFTGHKSPDIHLHMLDVAHKHNFHFDTVQMPLNVMDAHYNSFADNVIPVAQKEGIAILGMKPMGDHFILQSNTVTPIECLHYAMNLPTSVVITGCDSVARVQQALEAARSFKPLSKQEVAAILARTAIAAKNGDYEKYKTSAHFDGTVHHPEFLTKAS